MPFVKLDCGILTSTIWDDVDARMVFLTALLMAEPREFRAPVPQIAVRRLEETGWSAPAGWYGFVPAAGSGIVRRAGGMSVEDGLTALERLGAPEQESRSQAFDGRRLIRVDGGYLVLNYEKYRERDYTAAERTRRWRERQRETRNGDAVTRNVTQAEAEAEAEAEESTPIIATPGNARTMAKATAKTLVESFAVEDSHRIWAAQNCPSVPVDEETEAWKDRLRANGYLAGKTPVRDAAASWRTSMKNAEKWGSYRQKGNGNGRSVAIRAEQTSGAEAKPVRDFGHRNAEDVFRELDEKRKLHPVPSATSS